MNTITINGKSYRTLKSSVKENLAIEEVVCLMTPTNLAINAKKKEAVDVENMYQGNSTQEEW